MERRHGPPLRKREPSMRASDRQTKLQRAKELSRIAYSFLRFEDIVGVITLEGEEKHLREFNQQPLSGSLLIPFRSTASGDEFSRIQVRHLGRKVLELRWSKTGDFKLMVYEPGEWEEQLEPARERVLSKHRVKPK